MPLPALSDESKQLLLASRLAASPFTSAYMGLSTGNVTPTHATTLVSLLADELTVPGYTRQLLTGWTPPGLTGDFHAISYANPVAFTNNGGGATPTIYTWWFYDSGNVKLILAGRFDVPFTIPSVGTFQVTPFYRLTGEA